AAAGASGGEQLAIARAARLHDLRNAPDRADVLQLAGDPRVDFARHRIAAVARRAHGQRLDLALAPVAQIAVDEALHFRARAALAAQRSPPRGAAQPVEPALDLIDLSAQLSDRRVRRILPRHQVEGPLQRADFGIDIHAHSFPSATKNTNPPPFTGEVSAQRTEGPRAQALHPHFRHPREGGDPAHKDSREALDWAPAFAGMTRLGVKPMLGPRSNAPAPHAASAASPGSPRTTRCPRASAPPQSADRPAPGTRSSARSLRAAPAAPPPGCPAARRARSLSARAHPRPRARPSRSAAPACAATTAATAPSARARSARTPRAGSYPAPRPPPRTAPHIRRNA